MKIQGIRYFLSFLVLCLFFFPILVSAKKADDSNEWILAKTDLNDFSDTTVNKKNLNLNKQAIWRIRGGIDSEGPKAISDFFYNKVNGIVMEIGAVNGFNDSVSIPFEQMFGWKRILVEANPLYKDELKQQKNSFVVSAAVCNTEQDVHYVLHGTKKFIGGIVEFMHANHLMHHPRIYGKVRAVGNNFTAVDWESIIAGNNEAHAVHTVRCLPMSTILKTAKVKHVDFFVLDVEGAEISVLETIDFNAVSFDVMSIEEQDLQGRNEPKIQKFFEQHEVLKKDYEFLFRKGRNLWFKRKNFIPVMAKL